MARDAPFQEGPYVQISDWMQRMGKTDADFNKQAIITAEETDAISHELSMMSSQGGYKISLIWLPERMNLTSANKILKLLEEPPHQTLFLLVSEQPELLLETIRSRTQRIDLKKIETSEDGESAHRTKSAGCRISPPNRPNRQRQLEPCFGGAGLWQ